MPEQLGSRENPITVNDSDGDNTPPRTASKIKGLTGTAQPRHVPIVEKPGICAATQTEVTNWRELVPPIPPKGRRRSFTLIYCIEYADQYERYGKYTRWATGKEVAYRARRLDEKKKEERYGPKGDPQGNPRRLIWLHPDPPRKRAMIAPLPIRVPTPETEEESDEPQAKRPRRRRGSDSDD